MRDKVFFFILVALTDDVVDVLESSVSGMLSDVDTVVTTRGLSGNTESQVSTGLTNTKTEFSPVLPGSKVFL